MLREGKQPIHPRFGLRCASSPSPDLMHMAQALTHPGSLEGCVTYFARSVDAASVPLSDLERRGFEQKPHESDQFSPRRTAGGELRLAHFIHDLQSTATHRNGRMRKRPKHAKATRRQKNSPQPGRLAQSLLCPNLGWHMRAHPRLHRLREDAILRILAPSAGKESVPARV